MLNGLRVKFLSHRGNAPPHHWDRTVSSAQFAGGRAIECMRFIGIFNHVEQTDFSRETVVVNLNTIVAL